MQINLLYDQSTTTAPNGFKTDMAAAAQYLDQTIANPITLTIKVGWGETGGTSIGSALATGGPDNGIDVTYTQLKGYLAANATSNADGVSVAHLPAGNPTTSGVFYVTTAQEKAWGLISPSAGGIDGEVGFSTTAKWNFSPTNRAVAGENDFFGAALHELTHALGRISGLQDTANTFTVQDLFRYSSVGHEALASGTAAYFSIDGGATNLNPFDISQDPGDWASSVNADSFGYSYTGSASNISAADLTQLDVLGFTLATTPQVQSVAFSAPRSVVGIGGAVSIAVRFSTSVTVSGAPALALNNGGRAGYAGGSGSQVLTFAYTVGPGDTAVGALQATMFDFGSGTIASTSGDHPQATSGAMAQSGPGVDPIAPVVVGFQDLPTANVLGVGQAVTFSLQFSKAVTVDASTALYLGNGASAAYLAGSGSTTVQFRYVVGAGDGATPSLTISGIGGGAITDAAGNAALINAPALMPSGPAVDTAALTIQGVSMSPATGDLGTGRTVVITLALSKAATVAGAPYLGLNDAGVATYSGGSGTASLTFSYTVAAGAPSVAALAVTGFATNGGAVVDAAGNSLAFPVSGFAPNGPRIDTSAPLVDAIAISPGTGSLSGGGSATITVALSKPVMVTGAPRLVLNDGGTATYVGQSGSQTLRFLTTVDATDQSLGALAATAFDLGGGAITDIAGNSVAVSLAAIPQAGPAVAVAAGTRSSAGGGLPDVGAALTPVSSAILKASLGALEGASLNAAVVMSASGTTTVPAVAGMANAVVATSVPSGGVVGLPRGYAAAYLVGGSGATLIDGTGGALLVATTQNDTVIGAAGDTLIGGNGAATLVGTTGAATLVGGAGSNLIALGASTADVFSQGSDTILGGTSNTTITASGSGLLFGGSGALQFEGSGGSPTLVGGGAATVDAGGSSVLLFGGTGPLDFVAGTGASTVVGGVASAVSLTGGAAPLLYFGTGATNYVGGSAVDTVVGYTGSLTGTGGSNGTLFFSGAAGGNQIDTGSGSSTIVGSAGGDRLSASGAGSDVIAANGGSSTIDGSQSSGTNTYFAFGGNSAVFGGAGQTAIEAGAGNDTLVAGSGTTLFIVLAGVGARTDVIGGFDASHDFVQLAGYDAGAGAAAVASATMSGGSEILTLPDGTVLTFAGVGNLQASSFV